jgi:hypothetical protein
MIPIETRKPFEDCCFGCGSLPKPESGKEVLYDPVSVCWCVGGPARIGKNGENILLCGKRRSSFPYHCMLGPDWMMMLMVYVMIIGVNAIILPLISALGVPVMVIGILGCVALLISYSAVACSDPGIIYKNPSTQSSSSAQSSAQSDAEKGQVGGAVVAINSGSGVAGDNGSDSEDPGKEAKALINPSQNNSRGGSRPATLIECGHCEIQRPMTARHCNYCGVCVENLDHHCPCKLKYVRNHAH